MRLFWRVGTDTWHGGPRPRRHTPQPPPPFPASLHERNIAPAGHSTAWLMSSVKEISPLLAQNRQNTAFFGVPGRRIFHGTPQHLTQGRFFFHPSPIPPPGGTKLALLCPIRAQAGKNSPSTLKTPQNQRFFACRANFFSVSPRIHSCWASFFTPMGATATSQHLPTTSPETDNTNAGGSLPRDETTDTFARTKQANSGHLPPAKVSRVSCAPRRAPAKALPVSPSPDATPTAQTSRGVRTHHKVGGTLAA